MEFTESDKQKLDDLHDFVFGNFKERVTGADEKIKQMATWMKDHISLHDNLLQESKQRRIEEKRDKRQIMIGIGLAIFTTILGATVTLLIKAI